MLNSDTNKANRELIVTRGKAALNDVFKFRLHDFELFRRQALANLLKAGGKDGIDTIKDFSKDKIPRKPLPDSSTQLIKSIYPGAQGVIDVDKTVEKIMTAGGHYKDKAIQLLEGAF
jgi:hypothetical protein